MWYAVVPAYNEGESIEQVINVLNKTNLDKIVIVANGCTDSTVKLARKSSSDKPLAVLEFGEPLGIDVPRAVGAAYVLSSAPKGIVFVDGDMSGEISPVINKLILGVEGGWDMALTNCYPYITQRNDLANTVLKLRERVNRKLGLFNKLGLASPSHGPHAVSKRFLDSISPLLFAIPPLSLAAAAQNGLEIGVAASIAHGHLGSKSRSAKHGLLMAHSIIEDCRLALSYIDGEPLAQVLAKGANTGYRALRRFDILERIIKDSAP